MEIGLEVLEARLRTVQLALETLTGAYASLPDPPQVNTLNANEEDKDWMAEGAESFIAIPLRLHVGPTDEIDLDVDMDRDRKEEPVGAVPELPPFVFSLIKFIQPTSLSFPPVAAPSLHAPTTSALGAVHVTALECLSNIFLGLSVAGNAHISRDVQTGIRIWNEIWQALGSTGTETGPGQERRQDVWNTAVGALWGVGNIWKSHLASLCLPQGELKHDSLSGPGCDSDSGPTATVRSHFGHPAAGQMCWDLRMPGAFPRERK